MEGYMMVGLGHREERASPRGETKKIRNSPSEKCVRAILLVAKNVPKYNVNMDRKGALFFFPL
jgi:hypothetical protein